MPHELYIISVFIHIVASCLWVGGMLFLMLAFIPGIKGHPDKVDLIYKVSLKFRLVGTVALGILLLTGIIQLEYRGIHWSIEYFTQTYFGRIVGLKILVFIFIVFISLIHDHYLGNRAIKAWKSQPDHQSTSRLRMFSRLLGRLSFLLALLAVILGVILVRGW